MPVRFDNFSPSQKPRLSGISIFFPFHISSFSSFLHNPLFYLFFIMIIIIFFSSFSLAVYPHSPHSFSFRCSDFFFFEDFFLKSLFYTVNDERIAKAASAFTSPELRVSGIRPAPGARSARRGGTRKKESISLTEPR